jgi:hypothetical protein
MDDTTMRSSPIDREYLYRYESPTKLIVGGVILCGMFGSLGLFALYFAISDFKPIEFTSGVTLVGPVATLAKLGASLFLFCLAGGTIATKRREYRAGKQRIALTHEGVIMPRDQDSKEEVFVRFRDIVDLRFEPPAAKSVTSARLDTRSGSYIIDRGKLGGQDFEQITRELMVRIRKADVAQSAQSERHSSSPSTLSSLYVTDVAKASLAGKSRQEIRAYLKSLGLSEEDAARTMEAARSLIRQQSRSAGWSMFAQGSALLLIFIAATAFQYFFLLNWLGHNTIYVSASLIGIGIVYTAVGLLKGVTGWNIR